jgi:hypothetical protein
MQQRRSYKYQCAGNQEMDGGAFNQKFDFAHFSTHQCHGEDVEDHVGRAEDFERTGRRVGNLSTPGGFYLIYDEKSNEALALALACSVDSGTSNWILIF